MVHTADPLVVAYLFTAVVTAIVAWRTLQHRHVPGARPFGVVVAAVTVWTLLSAMLQHPLFQGSVVYSFLVRVVWLPVGVVAVGWLAFGLAYTGRESVLTPRVVGVLSVVPAVTVLVGLTHPILLDQYAAVLAPVGLDGLVEPLRPVAQAWDTVSLVAWGYTYLLLGAGTLFLLEVIVERPVAHPGQLLMLAVVAPPWALNAAHLFVFDFQSFNPTILGFSVSAVVGLFAVGRFKLFDVPLARARVVEDLDSGVLVYGPDGLVYDYNERAASLLELDDDAPGTDVRGLLAASPLAVELPTGEDLPLAVQAGDGTTVGASPAVDGGAATLADRLDGRTVPVGGDGTRVEVRLSTLSNVTGRSVSRVLRLYDVTERERNRRELERSRERYRTIFENSQVFLWELDLSTAKRRADDLAAGTDDLAAYLADNPDDHQRVLAGMDVIDVNRAALEFYEADSKAHLVENLEETMTDASLDTLRHLWATVAAGETEFRTDCEALTLGGDRRDMLLDMGVPATHAEDYSRVFLSGLDITERRERERELRRKNELLDEFASVVSHDVATPLGVIENKARLAEVTGDTEHVDDIYEATERVQELVDDLRELARQGKEVGETRPVAVSTVAREAWQSVESPAATLAVESARTVEADPDRLRQLFENLFENAVEHGDTTGPPETTTEPGGDDRAPRAAGQGGTASETGAVTVTVGTTPAGFYVADDGPGIPEADRDRVFERGVTTDEDSTGLGLAIVRRIADGHGWSVTATESADGGARFEVRTDD